MIKSEYWFERWLVKLETRYGKFAIPGLMRYIIGLNIFVYLLSYYNPQYVGLLTLNIKKVFQGEVWRLFTYIFIPPPVGFIFLFFALYFLYIIGTALEVEWGSFRLNMYYLIAIVATTVIAICFPSSYLTNVYINLSLFLAFANLYPDFPVYLFFIIPIKVKYIAMVSWLSIFLNIAFSTLEVKLIVFVSLLNYFLFMWPVIIQNIKVMHSKAAVGGQFSSSTYTFHKCSVCQKTEKDDENLEFRVCTKCGQEFCLKHLDEHKVICEPGQE
jgi:hypothetical protein